MNITIRRQLRRGTAAWLMWLWAGATAAKSLEAQDLPFDPPAPDPHIELLGKLDGTLQVCSTRLGDQRAIVDQREFQVSVERKVIGQVVTIDLFTSGDGTQRNIQSSFIVHNGKSDRLEEVTVSAGGAVEFWDELVPREGELLALGLRGKARFTIGDDPDQPMDFRKAYHRIDDAGFELRYQISADDGVTWNDVFHEVAIRSTGPDDKACEGVRPR